MSTIVCALNGAPLWNVTPSRSVTVHTVKSSFAVASVASQPA